MGFNSGFKGLIHVMKDCRNCMAAHSTVTFKICMLLSFKTWTKHALYAFFSIPCYWIIIYHIYL